MSARSITDCTLCAEFAGQVEANLFFHYQRGQSTDRRIIAQSRRLLAIPTLGQLVFGHILLCTRKHYRSFGNAVAGGVAPAEIDGAVGAITRWVSSITRSSVIAFEHGAVSGGCNAGACADHAHLHLLPFDRDLLPRLLQAGLDLTKISSYSDLAKWAEAGVSYLLYSDQTGTIWACDSPERLPQRFFRSVVADALGEPYRSDWRAFPELERIQQVVEAAEQSKITASDGLLSHDSPWAAIVCGLGTSSNPLLLGFLHTHFWWGR